MKTDSLVWKGHEALLGVSVRDRHHRRAVAAPVLRRAGTESVTSLKTPEDRRCYSSETTEFPIQPNLRAIHFRSLFSRRIQAAFTLIELLVGLAVLAILVTLLTGAFSNFSQMTSASKGRIEMNKQTRMLFDRMAFDLDSAVQHGGVQIGVAKNAALPGGSTSNNDVLTMLTRASTSGTNSRLAKIGYAVAPYEDQTRAITTQSLFRYVEPFTWLDDTTTISITNANNAQPIAPEVIRFELAFVDKEGNILADPPASGAAAMICSVATLDADSLQKLDDTPRGTLGDLFVDAVDGEVPLEKWEAVDLSGLPAPVQRGLRFQQRYFRVE